MTSLILCYYTSMVGDTDQQSALSAAEEWWRAKSRTPFILNGHAGTGKTTLAKQLAENAQNPTFLAPTGKAAHVLTSKGCPATTVHSEIYLVGGQRKDAKERLRAEIAATTDEKKLASLRARLQALNSPKWIKRDELRTPHTDLIIVDEISMVTADMMNDLLSFGVPVMGLGDPGQLPPVSGRPQPYPATATLTRIRRTDTPELLDLATAARTRAQLPPFDGVAGCRPALPVRVAAKAGQVLCGTNATRWYLNKKIRREIHGTSYSALPRPGDKVMALANKPDLGVVNGQIEIVKTVYISEDMSILTAAMVSGVVWSMPADAFRSHEDEQDALDEYRRVEDIVPATWAWAITTHKCVHPDTLVETGRGLQTIKDISDSGVIATPTGMKPYHTKFTRAESETLTIKTKRGYAITVTPDHGMTSWLNGHVRVEASKLRIGSWLRMKLGETSSQRLSELPPPPKSDVRAVNYKFPAVVTAEVAEFFGLMVADGTVYRGGFRLAKRHIDVVDRFVELAAMLFGCTPKRIKIGRTHGAEINSTEISAWLSVVGGMNPHDKYVPKCILESNYHAEFLKGLFEDGTVNVKSGVVDHVEWSNISSDVAAMVQTMLLRLGIVSSRATYKGQCRVSIYDIFTFRDRIGFVSNAKNSAIHNNQIRVSGIKSGNIPVSRDEIDSMNLSIYERQNARANGYVSRAVAARQPELQDRLTWFYDPIVSIESGVSETICVTVPDGHRFLQNGFDGWNSQGSQWKSVVVVDESRVFRDQADKWLYTAVTRAQKQCVVVTKGIK